MLVSSAGPTVRNGHRMDPARGRELATGGAAPAMSRALWYALPVTKGDTVAVIGWSRNAAVAARDFGVTTIVPRDASREHANERNAPSSSTFDRLPLGDSSVDHVMLKALTPATGSVAPRELARIVRPGGTVLVVTRSRWTRARDDSHAPPRRRRMRVGCAPNRTRCVT